MDYTELTGIAYKGNGPEKLRWARKFYDSCGAALLEDKKVVSLLAALQEAAGQLDLHMAAMDMGKRCSLCAATEKGGCCSGYMGDENNDVLQLLMNMLAGVSLTNEENDTDDCFLLAGKGCSLLFKPIFCVNYLCSHIRTAATETELTTLERRTGALLSMQVELEAVLMGLLRRLYETDIQER